MKKAIWKGKKSSLIVLIVLTVVIGALAITGITYAVWREVSSDNQILKISIDDYNPSEKYIIFRALDKSGNFCAADNESAIDSYAVVGYSGLVAEVIIPEYYKEKPVTKVCTTEDDFKYRFNGNPVITSIVIPKTVTEISSSVFAEMALLAKVEILGDESADPITIGDLAFANCQYLTEFNCSRTINGARESYLLGTTI